MNGNSPLARLPEVPSFFRHEHERLRRPEPGPRSALWPVRSPWWRGPLSAPRVDRRTRAHEKLRGDCL